MKSSTSELGLMYIKYKLNVTVTIATKVTQFSVQFLILQKLLYTKH